MEWPLQIKLPRNERIAGSVFGQHITLESDGDGLDLALDDQRWRIALPAKTTKLTLAPTFGVLPFLLFLEPSVVVPARESTRVKVGVPMHLDLAASGVRLTTLRPKGLARALYGPVDNGILCWSVPQSRTPLTELRLAGHAAELLATVHVDCESAIDAPAEVTKVMIPTELAGLYTTTDGLRMSDVTLTILGEAEAEITLEPASGGEPLRDATGHTIAPTRRTFAFSHSYRNRTGLEYGF